MAIYKAGGTNTVTVANAVLERLESGPQPICEELHPDLRIEVVTNQARYIESAVARGAGDGGLRRPAGGAGALPLSAQLEGDRDHRRWRFPISVVATFFLMYTSDISLNIMSLGGLTLGIGLLVDNAIVVLESVAKRARGGAGRRGRGPRRRVEGGEGHRRVDHHQHLRLPADHLRRGRGGAVLRRPGADRHLLAARVAAGGADGDSHAGVAPCAVGGSGRGRRGASPGGRSPAGAWHRRPDLGGRSASSASSSSLWFGSSIVLRRSFSSVSSGWRRAMTASSRRHCGVLSSSWRWRLWSSPEACFFTATWARSWCPSWCRASSTSTSTCQPGTHLDVTERRLASLERQAMLLEGVGKVYSVAGASREQGGQAAENREHRGQITLTVAEPFSREKEERLMAQMREVVGDRAVDGGAFRSAVVLQFPETRGDRAAGLQPDAAASLLRRSGGGSRSHDGITDVESTAEGGTPELQVRFDRERLASYGLTVQQVAQVLRTKVEGDVASEIQRRIAPSTSACAPRSATATAPIAAPAGGAPAGRHRHSADAGGEGHRSRGPGGDPAGRRRARRADHRQPRRDSTWRRRSRSSATPSRNWACPPASTGSSAASSARWSAPSTP